MFAGGKREGFECFQRGPAAVALADTIPVPRAEF